MRLVAINEQSVPVRSEMRNAVFSFADMTTSVVAVVTDVIRDGKPVVGYAFNSTGRYACGAQMRARFIPRLLGAAPAALLDAAGTNLDPAKALAVMLAGEKPGGHSERSIAIGTIEVALWDAVAKIEGLRSTARSPTAIRAAPRASACSSTSAAAGTTRAGRSGISATKWADTWTPATRW